MEPITVFNNFHTYEDNVVRIGMEVLSRTHIVANFISSLNQHFPITFQLGRLVNRSATV